MAFKKMIKRTMGGYEYTTCPKCKEDQQIKKPLNIEVPYCSECRKAVSDITQYYCGYCGDKFTD